MFSKVAVYVVVFCFMSTPVLAENQLKRKTSDLTRFDQN